MEKSKSEEEKSEELQTIDWDSIIDEKYCYAAYVTDVYDADTVTCDIDVGFDIALKDQKIRLYGIDAPEMRGKERQDGIVSRDRLREIVLNKTIKLYTIKDTKGKFGRWLGVLKIFTTNINQLLVDEGLAHIKIY